MTTTQTPDQASPAIASLATKIARIMEEIDGIEKTGWNSNQRYNYLEASVVANTIRPLLAERNIAIFTSVVGRDEEKIVSASGSQGVRVVLHLAYTFVDGDTGASYTVYMDGEGQDYGDKATNKSYTTALKYLLLNTLVIGSKEDPEADESIDNDPRVPTKQASKAVLTELRNLAIGQLGWDQDRLISWVKGITKRDMDSLSEAQARALIKLLAKEANSGN